MIAILFFFVWVALVVLTMMGARALRKHRVLRYYFSYDWWWEWRQSWHKAAYWLLWIVCAMSMTISYLIVCPKVETFPLGLTVVGGFLTAVCLFNMSEGEKPGKRNR